MLFKKRSNSFDSQLMNEFDILIDLIPSQISYSPPGIPLYAFQHFKQVNKITELMCWQKECLFLLKYSTNLIIKAPIGSGKSLISDLFAVHCITSRPKTKVIYIVPYVSLIHERLEKLKLMCDKLELKCIGLFGGHGRNSNLLSYDIFVCSIERANSLVCDALTFNVENSKKNDTNNKIPLFDTISGIVIDEAQFLGDDTRGSLLELLITKIMAINAKMRTANPTPKKINETRIFMMTGTISNINELSQWIHAEKFIGDVSAITVQEKIKAGNKIYTPDGYLQENIEEFQDDHFKIAKIAQIQAQKGSVLIFAQSKQMCENLASHLSRYFQRNEELKKSREGLLNEMKYIKFHHFTNQQEWILNGVACHHAGVKNEERKLIEKYYKNGALKILVSTSTLCAGVNLPAKTVIIFGLESISRLTNSLYKQMCGRAGRYEPDKKGECIILCRECQLGQVLKLLRNSEQGVTINSALRETQAGLKRLLIEAIFIKLGNTLESLIEYTKQTFLYQMLKPKDPYITDASDTQIKKNVEDSVKFLLENECIEKDEESKNKQEYKLTKLGKAIYETGFQPEEILAAYFDLLKAGEKVILGDTFFLTYLVTPIVLNIQPNWASFHIIYRQKIEADSRFSSIKRVAAKFQIEEDYIIKCAQLMPPNLSSSFFNGKLSNTAKCLYHCRHLRFYYAMILTDLINNVDSNIICSEYKITQGQIQSMLMKTPIFTKKIVQLVKGLGWYNLYAILSHHMDSVTFGQSEELEDLMTIGDIKLNILQARAIYEAGYTDIQHLAYANPKDITTALLHSIDWKIYYNKSSINKFSNDKENEELKYTYVIPPSIDDAENLIITARKEYVKRKKAITMHNNQQISQILKEKKNL